MIKMQVIGHLGRDCTVNTVNGKNVINFTVAHTEKFKNASGEQQEKTTWVDCSWWTDRTAIAQYLTKGKQVYAEGQPEARSFQRNDGTPGSSLTLRVVQVQLLSSGQATGGGVSQPSAGSGQPNSSPSPVTQVDEPIDDLPF